MFSDGISEARRGTELFGVERVREVLRSCADRPCQEIAESLLAAVVDFSSGDLRDDIAILALRPLARSTDADTRG